MFRNTLRLLFALFCFVLLLAGCSSDSSGPTDPGGDDTPDLTVLDSKSQSIDSGGGSIDLSDGTSVVFPAGAVGEMVTYTVNSVDPDGYGESDSDIGRVVIECTGSVTEFDQPVEIMTPLPESMSLADSSMVFGGYIDEETGAKEMQPCTIRMVDGKPYAVLTLSHFSTGFIEWLFGKTPPASAGPLDVPYYGQGESSYCWAVSLQMVTQAVSFETRKEVTDIIGEMGVDEDGISSIGFRTNSTISSIVKSRTGVTPDRCAWDAVNYRNMKDYLRREIGVRGYPVAVHSTVWNHAVVIVGYDGSTFYIHDPASTNTSSVGYITKTWDEMVNGMGAGQFMVCLTVPKALDASAPSITVNVMPDAIQFNRPATDDDPVSRIYKYGWDYQKEDGYSFRDIRGEKSVSTLPGEVTLLKQGGDIEIVNSSRTAPQEVSLWVDVVCTSVQGAYYSENYRFTVSPNSTKRFTFDDIPVDEFRWNAENPCEYSFIARALTVGSLVDEQSIQFSIASVPVEITSMSPQKGGAGTEVTLKGSGFGTVPKYSSVLFDGIEAEYDTLAWSDTEIKVIVPENAETGPITVKHGDVEDESETFTVTEETVVTESFGYTTDSSFGGLVMSASMSYSLSAEVLDSWGGAETAYYGYEIQSGQPASLSISATATLDKYSETVTNADSSTTVITYHEPRFVPLTDTEYENWPLNISGEYDYSAHEKGVNFTFDDFNDRLTVSLVFEVTYDTQDYDKDGYLIKERENVFYNSRTVGIVSVSCR